MPRSVYVREGWQFAKADVVIGILSSHHYRLPISVFNEFWKSLDEHEVSTYILTVTTDSWVARERDGTQSVNSRLISAPVISNPLQRRPKPYCENNISEPLDIGDHNRVLQGNEVSKAVQPQLPTEEIVPNQNGHFAGTEGSVGQSEHLGRSQTPAEQLWMGSQRQANTETAESPLIAVGEQELIAPGGKGDSKPFAEEPLRLDQLERDWEEGCGRLISIFQRKSGYSDDDYSLQRIIIAALSAKELRQNSKTGCQSWDSEDRKLWLKAIKELREGTWDEFENIAKQKGAFRTENAWKSPPENKVLSDKCVMALLKDAKQKDLRDELRRSLKKTPSTARNLLEETNAVIITVKPEILVCAGIDSVADTLKAIHHNKFGLASIKTKYVRRAMWSSNERWAIIWNPNIKKWICVTAQQRQVTRFGAIEEALKTVPEDKDALHFYERGLMDSTAAKVESQMKCGKAD
eukprot:Gregarina_sp_Poly_1__547@NODE_1130_length_4995_cov_340_345373_g781_i0_p1_GENE_NODE_1130_length_4995_cov_340_345373_g781_i0NODE_1130_length_4995_cov_340_345373_g781_i0_p1_ORF_typecomplete_len464_score54_50_NODE_1130_length_4995_cov_340_345373_g781_i028144205